MTAQSPVAVFVSQERIIADLKLKISTMKSFEYQFQAQLDRIKSDTTHYMDANDADMSLLKGNVLELAKVVEMLVWQMNDVRRAMIIDLEKRLNELEIVSKEVDAELRRHNPEYGRF